jgi:hypothetical protein
MAFNPFHAFRKHQRPLIAGLAIFCMFMFVVSSGLGRGDAVYQLLGFIGIQRHQGSLVATLNGKKVTEHDLSLLRRDRELASRFLFFAAMTGAQQKVMQMAEEQQKNKEGPGFGPEINQTLMLWATIYRAGNQIQLPRSQRNDFARQSLEAVRRQIRINAATNPQGVRSLDELARVLAFEVWLSDPKRNSKEYYFGGTSDTPDLLDFILWEHQADRLGVVLTEADVLASIKHEAADQDVFGSSFNGDYLVQQFLSEGNPAARGATVDDLAKALNREFRYVFAQEAILGEESGARSAREGTVPQMPAAGTPREFLDWFREQRTTLKVAMLPIPVERFVGQIKESPPVSTLRNLYEQYKDDEPAPDRALPGFKEPRRVRVETASARPDSDFYRRAARGEALAPAAGAIVGGPYASFSVGSWLVACDPIWREYEIYSGEAKSWAERKIGLSFDLTDRRQIVPSVVGLAIGTTPGALLSVGTAAVAENALYDIGLAKLGGSLLPAGAGNQPLVSIALPVPYETTVLPMEQVENSLFTKMVESLAPRMVTKNLEEFRSELVKLKGRPDDAREYIAKSVAKYGLTVHLMQQARTGYQLADDPALQSLKQAVDAEAATTDQAPPDLAKVVLSGVGVYDPQPYPISRFSVVKEPFLWWRVEDLPARQRPFEAVRGQVEAAWRFEQARALAKAEAERIEAAVKKNVGDNKSATEATKVLRSFGQEFELNDVARLLPVQTPQAELGQPYRPYSVPHDLMPYPRPDLVDRLMTLKAPGDAIVVRDKPAANFYVAVLEDRSDPTMSGSKPDLRACLEEYRNADKPGSLWQQYFMVDIRRAYVQQVLKQMRIDATGGKVDEDGNIILPDNIARTNEAETTE